MKLRERVALGVTLVVVIVQQKLRRIRNKEGGESVKDTKPHYPQSTRITHT